jgi:hypothetical protein
MKRREFLKTKLAVSSIPVVGLSGCLAETQSALSGDMSPDEIVGSLSGTHSIGDSVSIDKVQISVIGAGSSDSFVYNTDGAGELVAPDGGSFTFFKIKFENSDIEEKEAPSFTTNDGRYESFGEDVDYLLGGNPTEIAVFSDGEPAIIPDSYSSDQSYSSISYSFDNASVVGYPDDWSIRPEVPPNSTLEGWVWGLTYEAGSVDCRVKYQGEIYTWEPSNNELDEPPQGTDEISI